jgi:hypothetical protein
MEGIGTKWATERERPEIRTKYRNPYCQITSGNEEGADSLQDLVSRGSESVHKSRILEQGSWVQTFGSVRGLSANVPGLVRW